MSNLTQYDSWLTSDSTAAIVIREPLVPVEGADGVIFPATYAAADRYCIHLETISIRRQVKRMYV